MPITCTNDFTSPNGSACDSKEVEVFEESSTAKSHDVAHSKSYYIADERTYT
jgi:hypothetical protein